MPGDTARANGKKGGRPKGSRSYTTLRKADNLAKLLADKDLADARWAEEVLALALHDPTCFYDKDGNVLPVSQWTPEMGRLVSGMEVIIKNAQAGDGHTDRVLKIKTWNKEKALELWGKYRSLLIDRTQVEHRFTLEDIIVGSFEMRSPVTKLLTD